MGQHPSTKLDVVRQYHEATKHHLFRYARALGYLDWANQPNPFRRYEGAPLLSLPILKLDEEPVPPPYKALYQADHAIPSVPVSPRAISRLFEYSLALSAWKQAGGTRWALRSNPSSGNLHPTEGYIFIGAVPGLAGSPALYHYAPKAHVLERRLDCPEPLFAKLMKDFPLHAFLVGLSSIHWREAWKYGERAFRYCQHDAGHAIAAMRIAAATLGWRTVLLEGLADGETATALGLDRTEDFQGVEREHPDVLMVVWPAGIEGRESGGHALPLPLFLDSEVVRELRSQTWHGRANRLSPDDPVPWEIIDAVTEASWKSASERIQIELFRSVPSPSEHPLLGVPVAHQMQQVTGNRSIGQGEGEGQVSAGQIIRQRRSALAFDGTTSLPAGRFFTMLERVMPRAERPIGRRPMPWDAVPWPPAIHLALFVHRVEGIPPGLYMLARDPAQVEPLRKATHPTFAWTSPPGCPLDLPLYLLEEGDAQRLAAQVSCHQEIAGASAFSLGMIAEFDHALEPQGPWFYRRLFWETGVIGQVLYLEAEAAGLRATGIGCFFDDPVHQVFGFQGTTYQSLYHFTTGGPVDDPRLTTLPPYGAHVDEQEQGMDLP